MPTKEDTDETVTLESATRDAATALRQAMHVPDSVLLAHEAVEAIVRAARIRILSEFDGTVRVIDLSQSSSPPPVGSRTTPSPPPSMLSDAALESGTFPTRIFCAEHASPIRMLRGAKGMAVCPSCGMKAMMCLQTHGSKECVLGHSHGGQSHISSSGSAWPIEELVEHPAHAPRVWWSQSTKEGSCSFCRSYISPQGTIPHDILVIQGPSIVVRACRRCVTIISLTKPWEENMGHHLIDGEFKSDKYPGLPAGKVALSLSDTHVQDLIWHVAERYKDVDAEFAGDLKEALFNKGFKPSQQETLTETVARFRKALEEILALSADRRQFVLMGARAFIACENIAKQALGIK